MYRTASPSEPLPCSLSIPLHSLLNKGIAVPYCFGCLLVFIVPLVPPGAPWCSLVPPGASPRSTYQYYCRRCKTNRCYNHGSDAGPKSGFVGPYTTFLFLFSSSLWTPWAPSGPPMDPPVPPGAPCPPSGPLRASPARPLQAPGPPAAPRPPCGPPCRPPGPPYRPPGPLYFV